jgi:hypothetical protein
MTNLWFSYAIELPWYCRLYQKLRSLSFSQIHDPHISHNLNELIFILAISLMHWSLI